MSILHDDANLTTPEPTAAADWPAWTDADRWAPTDPAAGVPLEALRDAGERRSMAEWLDLQANAYTALGTPLGAFLATRIKALASEARIYQADDPETLDERSEALDYHADGEALGRAWDAGYRAALIDAGRTGHA